jgi:Domain of unknown function (DUF4430)
LRLGGALALVGALALLGCGLGAGESRPGGVELRVTRDFGQQRLHAARLGRVRERDTVMGLLRAERRVETAYGGGFVESIDGLAGEAGSGRRDWFYFVNGLEAGEGAGERRLFPGDVVQWDYRRWDAAMSVPAIVGAYPEPMVSGSKGRRLPVRIECADSRTRSCRETERRLRADGVIASVGPFGDPGGEGLVRVIVAPWPLARRAAAAAPLDQGPGASGVFARFGDGGRRLELLDPAGRVARTAPPGSGLVVATAREADQRVWIVTGGDEAGVERAAAALDRDTLRDRYAVAALPRGVEPLPLVGESR